MLYELYYVAFEISNIKLITYISLKFSSPSKRPLGRDVKLLSLRSLKTYFKVKPSYLT